MKKIEVENDRQKEILKNYDEVDDKAYDETVDKKGELVDQLLLLDEAFKLFLIR